MFGSTESIKKIIMKTMQLKEAQRFAMENGYLLAVYKKEGDNYKLYNICYTVDTLDEDTLITVERVGTGVNFRAFTTVDKQFCFRLHSNFNVPNIIPIIERP